MLMGRNHHSGGMGRVIYVIDDEPMLLDLAEVILKPEGFDVRTFRDPGRALAEYAASAPPPLLVITDYAMDGMNGLDLTREFRRLHPDQKIIMVSGTVDENIYATVEVKPDLFIAKPYNVDRFIATIKDMADG